ncbi:MAG: divalent-cation tolerance protein CutA [Rubripirellula sp.]|nr:divalent-cation tolerance protein CutA [Rubripirellula sp.]
MSDSIAIVLTTVESIDDANRLAADLLEQRLAACIQIDGPIVSHYRWEGKLQRANEYRMTIKVAASEWPKLSAALSEQHPYDEPEIILLPVESASQGYQAWVLGQTM